MESWPGFLSTLNPQLPALKMWETFAAFFAAVGKTLGLVAQRDAEKNAADVKAAAEAGSEQKQVDAATTAVAKDDVEEIRNDIAE